MYDWITKKQIGSITQGDLLIGRNDTEPGESVFIIDHLNPLKSFDKLTR